MLGRWDNTKPGAPTTLLTITGQMAKMEGKFDIADSLHVECEVGGELNVGGQLVIGERGVVNANVRTVDAIIQGTYEGNLVATGTVEVTATGRVIGNVETDSMVISKGGFFNGNVVKSSRAEGEKAAPAPAPAAAAVAASHQAPYQTPYPAPFIEDKLAIGL